MLTGRALRIKVISAGDDKTKSAGKTDTKIEPTETG